MLLAYSAGSGPADYPWDTAADRSIGHATGTDGDALPSPIWPGLGSVRNWPGLTSWSANMIRPVQAEETER